MIGCLLGDAHQNFKGKYPFVKFEQGWKQKEFLLDPSDLLFNGYAVPEPHIRYEQSGSRKGLIKSYDFKTFSHPTFNQQADWLPTGAKK